MKLKYAWINLHVLMSHTQKEKYGAQTITNVALRMSKKYEIVPRAGMLRDCLAFNIKHTFYAFHFHFIF